MRTLIRNIKTLAGILPEGQRLLKGKAMAHLESIDNAYVLIENGLISNFGSMDDCPESADEMIN